ncbi:three-Cys-motif partner protein TcmP [Halobacteriaceae archaeon GCM10025711]
MLADDDPDKWVLKEHTEVKHRILRKYLVPWTRILSSGNPRIHYFDGFAGRGYYEDGEPGSPLLAMDVADEHADLFDEFLCTFIEKNSQNYSDLVEAVEQRERTVSDKVKVYHHNEAFADVARDLMDSLEGEIVPSFFFIDPFGYKGVPFELISEILNLRDQGVEVFLTFMVRDIRRFLTDEGHENSISEIMGTDAWKEIRDQPNIENKEEEILKLYEQQLKQAADMEYVWPFEMKMPERRETVYYLIHSTNHFMGFKIMKDVMFVEGAEDQFAYLGPEHYGYDSGQQKIFEHTDNGDRRIHELADYLFEELEDRRLTFWDVMKETYTETKLIEKHYRKAVKLLAEQHRAEIHNFPDRPKGSTNGVQPDDEVEFVNPNAGLTDWT